MTARIALLVMLSVVTLLGGGCAGDNAVGKYAVVDIGETSDGIKDMPMGLSNQMTLPEYRQHIRNRYSDKTLELTAKHPHAFLFSVPLEGTVRGLLDGGWKREEKDKSVISIYEWVSGSIYLFWGQATLSNKDMTIVLNGTNSPVLHFRKVK
jgi:hypothetical protein